MTPSKGQAPITSLFADDPEMRELIAEFAGEMPKRAETLLQLLNESRLAELRSLAHQLKGAGSGYGFDMLSEAAAALEATLLRQGQAELGEVNARVSELADMCSRVVA